VLSYACEQFYEHARRTGRRIAVREGTQPLSFSPITKSGRHASTSERRRRKSRQTHFHRSYRRRGDWGGRNHRRHDDATRALWATLSTGGSYDFLVWTATALSVFPVSSLALIKQRKGKCPFSSPPRTTKARRATGAKRAERLVPAHDNTGAPLYLSKAHA
jgi:hypothetical protein